MGYDGWVVFETKLDTKDFDKQISEVEYELEQIEYELSKKKELKLDDRTISEYESKAEKLRNKIIDLKKRQEDLNNTNLRDVEKSIDNVGSSVSRVIKKLGKWVLAVFSIRSAYTLISKSVSTLSQYNDQIKTDIEYIGFALATALQPVVEYLISLVYSLLNIINSISVSWLGINLFANATADAMNKTNKSAKQLKKTLVGFDEMNVLQDTSTAGGGATTKAPSVDLTQIDEKAVEKTKNFWGDVGKFWEEDIKYLFEEISGNWELFIESFLIFGQGVYYVFKGVFNLVIGLIELLVSAFQGDMDKLEKAWKKMGDALVDILVGVGGLIMGILGAVFGTIKGIFLDLWDGIVSAVNTKIDKIKNIFNSLIPFFKFVKDSILALFKTIAISVGNVIGGAFKGVVNGVLGAIENILNSHIKTINSLIKTINKVPGINLSTLGTFKLPRLAVGGIVNMPGRGVPIGGAITGERGAEGVIPLTDSQAMETLGATIGRYITINANITNTMNGRVISRELQKINTNSDFARNG